MKTTLARLGLAAMMAVSGLAAFTPATKADDIGVEFSFGDQGHRRHNWDGDVQTRDWNRDDRRRGEWDRDREWRRPRGCFPGEAVEKARYQGLRHARIGYITPRSVVVVGRGPYGREQMIFANVRGCPLVSD